MSRIEDLKRLEQESTPGKWYWMHNAHSLLSACDSRRPVVLLASEDGCFKTRDAQGFLKQVDEDDADPNFIVEMRNAMPALLAVVDAVKPLVDEWKDQPVIDDYVYHTRQAVVEAFKQLEKL